LSVLVSLSLHYALPIWLSVLPSAPFFLFSPDVQVPPAFAVLLQKHWRGSGISCPLAVLQVLQDTGARRLHPPVHGSLHMLPDAVDRKSTRLNSSHVKMS